MVDTFTVVSARISSAIVDVFFTILSCPAFWAFAGVIVDEIGASTTVLARAA